MVTVDLHKLYSLSSLSYLAFLPSHDFWDDFINQSLGFRALPQFLLKNFNLTLFGFRKLSIKPKYLIASVEFLLKHLLFIHWTKWHQLFSHYKKIYWDLMYILHVWSWALYRLVNWETNEIKLKCSVMSLQTDHYRIHNSREGEGEEEGEGVRRGEKEGERLLYTQFRDQGRDHGWSVSHLHQWLSRLKFCFGFEDLWADMVMRDRMWQRRRM